MKRTLLLLTLFISIFIVGCGGSGGGKAQPSVFLGNYDGTWTSTDTSVGTAVIEVEPNGDFAGEFVNTTFSLNGTFHGHLNDDGTFEGALTLSGNEFEGAGQFVLSEDKSSLTGSFTRQSTTWTFDFSRILN